MTAERFGELEAAGEILYRNDRYGNVYGVDRHSLDALSRAVHSRGITLARSTAYVAMEAYPVQWLRVLLWCDRRTTDRRSVSRGDNDTATRLAVWDETKQDLEAHPNVGFDLRIRTDRVTVTDAARAIQAAERSL